MNPGTVEITVTRQEAIWIAQALIGKARSIETFFLSATTLDETSTELRKKAHALRKLSERVHANVLMEVG